jgi:predicted metal-dependent peptidase
MPFNDLTLPEKYKNFEDRWKWIIAFMVLEDKFVHEILLLMTKSASNAVPTMGVFVKEGRLNLHYNLDFANMLTDPELRYVVTHEIYHTVLHHVTHRMPKRPEDHKIYNIAGDLAINSLIPESPSRHMPKRRDKDGKIIAGHLGVLPKDYEFKEKLSMEQYVLLLKEKGETGEGYEGFDDHGGWSDTDQCVVDQIIKNKIQQVAKKESVWGSVPSDVQAIILAAQRGSVPWYRYLREYMGNLISAVKERSCKRINKRYGLPFRGVKRAYTDRKLVGWDTSGSVGDEDLSRFLSECNTLSEIQPVDMVMFDCQIASPIMPFDDHKPKIEVKGRGGTDFQPLFDLAEKNGYQSLIILTDGCAGAPKKPTTIQDVLWVLTDPSCKPPVPWGECVWITPKGVPQPTRAADVDDPDDAI